MLSLPRILHTGHWYQATYYTATLTVVGCYGWLLNVTGGYFLLHASLLLCHQYLLATTNIE